MDSLDFNLHSAILSSLAANLASSSTQDDLSLLTDSFSTREPVTNGLVNGVLARLGLDQAASTQQEEPITTQQAEGIIAFAEFSAQSLPSQANLDRILALLSSVPTWEIEASLGLRASQDWALPDQLVYALVAAVLSITAHGSGDRHEPLGTLANLQGSLVAQLSGAPGHRIIGHLLPMLNGLRRAVVDTAFPWKLVDPSPAGISPTAADLEHITSAATYDWDISSEEGRISLASIQRYQASLKGLSAGLVPLGVLECRQAYLASALAPGPSSRRWEGLVSYPAESVMPEGGDPSVQSCLDEALALFDQTLALLEDDELVAPMDPYAFDILLETIKVATLASLTLKSPDAKLMTILHGLTGEGSQVTDEALQIGAIQCLQILSQAFPSLLPQATKQLRQWILSPSPIFEQDADLVASRTLRAASVSYAKLVLLSKDTAKPLSTIQSLLNHFTSADSLRGTSSAKAIDSQSFRTISDVRPVRTENQRGLISVNVAHAISIVAQAFGIHEIYPVAVSMLLQKLGGTDPAIEGALMIELADLTRVVDHTAFVDIVKALSKISKTARAGDAISMAVLTAQTSLAVAAAARPELHDAYLLENLTLFVDKGMDTSQGSSQSATSKSLLDLILVLDTFFGAAKVDPHRQTQSDIVGLFRSLWYLCVCYGFLSPTSNTIAPWQRALIARLAQYTPGLLTGAGDDFVQTELEFNSILRRKTHVLSADTIRSELAAAVPQQAGAIRSLPTAQAVFLTAVVRVEVLRAGAGQPSTILSYFAVDGINSSPLFSTLASIADQVNSAFVSHFSKLVTTHAIDDSVYGEVRKILLYCCDQNASVRIVSLRYLNELIASFPSLLCESTVVTVLLELLTVLRRACQAQFLDEYTPTYSFESDRAKFTLVLPDDYTIREAILSGIHHNARAWLKSAITRAPLEMQGLLQDYIDGASHIHSESHVSPLADDEMGKSVAIDMVRMLPSNAKEATLPQWGGWKSDNSSHFARTFGTRSFYGGEAAQTPAAREALLAELNLLSDQIRTHKLHAKLPDLRSLFYRCAAHVVKSDNPDVDILHQIVALPIRIFNDGAVALAQEVWTWIADARPDLESRLMVEVTEAWSRTVRLKQGLFSSAFNRRNPLDQETQFTPTDKPAMMKEYARATRLLHPHVVLLSFLSSRFQAFRYRDRDLVLACMRLLMRSSSSSKNWSSHPLARELRMRLLSFGFCVLQGSRAETSVEFNFRVSLYDAALSWFAIRAGWSFGTNRIQLKSDLQAVEELYSAVKLDSPTYSATTNSATVNLDVTILPGQLPLSSGLIQQKNRQRLLLVLLNSEADRLRLWINPLMDLARGPVQSAPEIISEASWRQLVRIAWALNPTVAIHLPERFKVPVITAEVTRLVRSDPTPVEGIADALTFFVGESITADVRSQLRHLLYWAPVPVISALRFLFPKFGGDPILLQYALRVLEHHPVEVTFFYIPQVVQALRTDALGYAERFIFETSKISQLFCHQIIWNMKANAYRGDAGEEADPMKPTLDHMVEMIVESLSGEAKDFFQREFAFFDEVTSISAKLKPFIKSSKLEKKAKIDEEMAKIKVDPGVYLPSNPDGVVVDIDRTSGRPLQSHAKAPFMATFKVRRELKTDHDSQEALIELEEDTEDSVNVAGFDTWQSAIFKVGDDCRQDVLALQIIAMHKNIFTSLGLDLLVTPYRVTATGPGCGVIDVIPNATSRDEMGRAKVNDLRSFFILKYGGPDSVHFQKARNNFIQSMAAYSLLCYIVQIKDRHNGNIMIDGHGCLIHIDFGFLFDIDESPLLVHPLLPVYLPTLTDPFSPLHVPGVKFEPGSFKLSREMVTLMGGRDSVGFRQFSELTVKAFLACRPYGQAVVDTSGLMLAAEFPSFKGEPTMTRLAERFRLDLTETDAAIYMKGVIENAYENPRSIVYDYFQELQNGIPYVR